MISINVRTNTTRRTVSEDITATPKQVFDELGIDYRTSKINVNGRMLAADELEYSFESLGIEDGTTADLGAVVKADGARF